MNFSNLKNLAEDAMWYIAIISTLSIFTYTFILTQPAKYKNRINKENCITKKKEISSMIIEVSGRNDDVWLRLANESELIHVSIKKEVYNIGFDDYHSYDEGDSIIKKQIPTSLL
jgi:hypothetical protein